MPALRRRDVARLHDAAALRRAGRAGRFSWDWPLPPLTARGPSARAPQLSCRRAARGLAASAKRPSAHQVQQLLDHRAASRAGRCSRCIRQSPRSAVPAADRAWSIADRFNDVGINFPALWTDADFAGVLPKGTPVAHCIPVSPRGDGAGIRRAFRRQGRALCRVTRQFWRRPESIAAATAARGRARRTRQAAEHVAPGFAGFRRNDG